MAETKQIEIMVGKKVSEADAKSLDRTKMGVGVIQPPAEEEVKGQDPWGWKRAECPCYGHIFWIYYDYARYHWYTCPYCGCQGEY